MTDYTPITEKLLETITNELIRGYRDKEGTKIYPTVKEAAEWYNVAYSTLRIKVGKLNWKQKKADYQTKVKQKVEAKKKQNDEEISEAEAEAIIVDDYQFNEAANKLRRATVKEIEKILNEEVVLFVTKEGVKIKGVPKNAPYQLMNAGKALESAQKVSKTAVGEPSEITTFTSKQEIKKTVDVFGRVDKLIQFIDRGNYNNADRTVQPQDTDKP